MRVILHSDLNNFYASVECMKNPEIKDKPVVVVGSKEKRHGIVLAKNGVAKKMGVKTGDVYWEAQKKCGNQLVEVKPDFDTYRKLSVAVRKIYAEYTDMVEPFGIDECWLDVTASQKIFGSGEQIANTIRERVKRELGLTVSVGVSWNKIFAKLGSDLKKPDAVTVINKENYKTLVWKLPVKELLYVGGATEEKLKSYGIFTIGDLANSSDRLLDNMLGKNGGMLKRFALGEDDSQVAFLQDEQPAKSIGNSMTLAKDVYTDDKIIVALNVLAEAVSSRMRESGFVTAYNVGVMVKDSNLKTYNRQKQYMHGISSSGQMAELAYQLFKSFYSWNEPVRALGIRVSCFTKKGEPIPLCFGQGKRLDADIAVDKLRDKYGNKIVRAGIVYKDSELKDEDIIGGHDIHTEGYF